MEQSWTVHQRNTGAHGSPSTAEHAAKRTTSSIMRKVHKSNDSKDTLRPLSQGLPICTVKEEYQETEKRKGAESPKKRGEEEEEEEKEQRAQKKGTSEREVSVEEASRRTSAIYCGSESETVQRPVRLEQGRLQQSFAAMQSSRGGLTRWMKLTAEDSSSDLETSSRQQLEFLRIDWTPSRQAFQRCGPCSQRACRSRCNQTADSFGRWCPVPVAHAASVCSCSLSQEPSRFVRGTQPARQSKFRNGVSSSMAQGYRHSLPGKYSGQSGQRCTLHTQEALVWDGEKNCLPI